MIIDAHMHLPYFSLGMESKRDTLLERMQQSGISYGIVISDSSFVSEIGNVQQCVDIFSDIPNVFIIGGISPLIEYEEQLKILDRYLRNHQIVGIKLFCGHEEFYLNDIRLESVYAMAAKYEVPILFHSGWENSQFAAPQIVKKVAKKYPYINLLCCHLFYPKVIECLERLNDFSNVYFDLSSIADDELLARNFAKELSEYIRRMPNRFLFGSDYAGCDQMKHIRFIQGLDITDKQRERLFYQNAVDFYRLQIMDKI